MSNESTKQYRAGFEAWFKSANEYQWSRAFDRVDSDYRYVSMETEWAFRGYVAGKRDASTEPSAGYGPVEVVGDLVRNLLTLDQATPIYSAFHLTYQGDRRCRTRPVSISRERVIDGKWIDSKRKDVPYAAIVWAKPQADEEAGAGALTDDAKDAGRYRWLRESANRFEPMYMPGGDLREGRDLDDSIDAAIEAKGEP